MYVSMHVNVYTGVNGVKGKYSVVGLDTENTGNTGNRDIPSE